MEDQSKLVRRNAADTGSLAAASGCNAPALNALLTAYCFGRAELAEAQRIQEHLRDCEACRQEVNRLTAVVGVLDTDRDLLQTLTPAGVAGAFGISGNLPLAGGGHQQHVQFASGTYALLGGLCLVMEFAYEFTQFAWPGLLWGLLAGLWLYGTTRVALWCDWKLTLQGNAYGLAVTMAVIVMAATLTVLSAYLFLPAYAITKLKDAALPAQLAYQKDLIYHVVFLFIFCLPTLHCVWRLQWELAEGNHPNILGLLSDDRRSVSPRGLLFPRTWVLVTVALFIFVYSIYAHFNLMAKLQPVSNYVLFATLVHLRLLCIYILIARCLYWYATQLNELKRECLIADRLKHADIGKREP